MTKRTMEQIVNYIVDRVRKRLLEGKDPTYIVMTADDKEALKIKDLHNIAGQIKDGYCLGDIPTEWTLYCVALGITHSLRRHKDKPIG